MGGRVTRGLPTIARGWTLGGLSAPERMRTPKSEHGASEAILGALAGRKENQRIILTSRQFGRNIPSKP